MGVLGIALALLVLTLFGTQARADTQDFRYDSWAVSYEIGTNDAGRAEARVTETITAVFPEFDQNRGIVRGLPDRYEGARIDPRHFTVTDGRGTPVPFEIETDDGFTAVLVGDDSFVHGVTTYVIGYTLSDVVLARDDGRADEFYWDVMDFEHAQPVADFSAEVRFTGALAGEVTGDSACYVGRANSTAECAITPDRAAASFRVEAGPLGPREGATVAIGLQPGSVIQPPTRLPSFVYDTLPVLVAGLALAFGATAFVLAARMRARRRVARGTIVAQYDVPASLPPLLASSIVASGAHPVPAEFVHLAVAGAIRIEASKPRPTLHLVDPGRAADPLDARTLEGVFTEVVPGSSFTVPKSSEAFARRMTKLRERGATEADARGYFERAHSPVARKFGIVGIVVSAAAMALGFVALIVREQPLPLLAIVAGAGALALSVLGTVPKRVHTRRGAEAREYLLGVREFIRVAEADRLEMLQSYAVAERRTIDGAEVVHLYERLLPYAMLFGLQKQWSRVLEVRYAAQADYTPVWFVGAGLGIMHVADLGSTISQFTSSTMSAVSYTSSSSGGSSGGGFAGGGGGGGFSGGR